MRIEKCEGSTSLVASIATKSLARSGARSTPHAKAFLLLFYDAASTILDAAAHV
jgi:hypothetical protein